MNSLLFVLIIQVAAHRLISIEAEADNLPENAATAGHLDYRTLRGWRRRRGRGRSVRAGSKHELRTSPSLIALGINIRREGLPAKTGQNRTRTNRRPVSDKQVQPAQ